MSAEAVSLEYRDGYGLDWTLVGTSSLVDIHFESALPIRTFSSYRAKHNYEGIYPFSNLDLQVPFESLLEGKFLLETDWGNESVAISAQPFLVHWENPTKRRHVPDYFVRLRNGDGLIVDVRPSGRIDDTTRTAFAFTRSLCEAVGWAYRVYDTPSEVFIANLRLFKQYAAFVCRDEQLVGILRAAQTPVSVAELVHCYDRLVTSDVQMRGMIFHLLWERRLVTDVAQPISSATRVWSKC
ncbi:MAG: TnsA-like heteromeric transposase endonuclease subunit [Ferrimicrobium acidiphilum]